MSFSFALNSKFQSNSKKRTTSALNADDPPTASAATASSTRNYVREFDPAVAPREIEREIKPIAPIPNESRLMSKLKNLPNLPSLSQSNGSDSSLQFEIDTGHDPRASDNSMAYGLNIRQQPAADGADSAPARRETLAELELRKLREDLEKLPDDTGMDDYTDVPVEGFGLALMSGYGWKEGMGIGRQAKEDVVVSEAKRKKGRGGLGFTGEITDGRIGNNNGKGVEKFKNANVEHDKSKYEKEKKILDIGKVVRIVSGKEMGMKGKVVEVRRDGEILVLRLLENQEKLKLRSKDVADLGSMEEEKCLRKLKELKIKEENVDTGKGQRKAGGEDERKVNDKVNWVRNHIRVRIISENLKGGRLFLKKGVVVDVVGPGICDVSMDESRELIQGVEQEFLETALPRRGGAVVVLFGRYKGVYGSLLERDSDKETGVVRDADTHEMINVRLDQIAEYTGDLSDIGY